MPFIRSLLLLISLNCLAFAGSGNSVIATAKAIVLPQIREAGLYVSGPTDETFGTLCEKLQSLIDKSRNRGKLTIFISSQMVSLKIANPGKASKFPGTDIQSDIKQEDTRIDGGNISISVYDYINYLRIRTGIQVRWLDDMVLISPPLISKPAKGGNLK